eukprot:6256813-Pyramimonas_sp.AAC.1
MSLLLRARAKLSTGKGPGPDNVTVMMSWTSLRRVLVSFQGVYSRRLCCPDSWRQLAATLRPKEMDIQHLTDTR